MLFSSANAFVAARKILVDRCDLKAVITPSGVFKPYAGVSTAILFKETRHIPRKPMVYDPGLCIVVQGHKIGYLGGQKFRYDANHYLVASVTIPFECETFASPEEPLRGLYIDIDMGPVV